jgi:hypothetical protein
MRKLTIPLVGVLIAMASSPAIHAKIYLLEDFESYEVGESLDAGDLWIIHQDANAPGEASDAVSYPPGGKSGYFPQMSGIKHIFAGGDLPEEFVISACYYHDSTQDPPPHYMLVFKGPGGSDWLGVGTVETVSNYSLRDKMGTATETDTGVKRKDWVNIVWNVSKDSTDVLIDGEEVYTSTIGGGTWNQDGSFIWFANVWSDEGEGYLDSLVIADTLEEATEVLAVEPVGKLSTTWGALKTGH